MVDIGFGSGFEVFEVSTLVSDLGSRALEVASMGSRYTAQHTTPHKI